MLIAKNANNRIEVLTLERDGEEILPVFSHEEEAGMFLQLADVTSWQVRKSSAGELISVLYGPCAKIQRVALDPLPEMMTEMTVGLISLDRERFIEHITTGRRRSSLRDSSFEARQGKQETVRSPACVGRLSRNGAPGGDA